MSINKLAGIAFAAALASACTSEPEAEKNEAQDQASRDHVLSDQFKAMDDARQLQDDLNAKVESRLKELDDQTKVKDKDD